MGNKNVRSGLASGPTKRGSMSVSTKALPAGGSKGSKENVGQKDPLAFKSFKNGTLMTNNFEPLDRVKTAKLPAVSRTGQASVPQAPMRPQPAGGRPPLARTGLPNNPPKGLAKASKKVKPKKKTFLRRDNFSLKDVVVQSSGVTRNVVKISRLEYPDGSTHETLTSEFDPDTYDFHKDLTSMSDSEQQRFWGGKYVEVIIDVGEVDAIAKDAVDENVNQLAVPKQAQNKILTIIDHINSLGPGFFTYTRDLFVTIKFPPLGTQVTIPKTFPLIDSARLVSKTGAIDFTSTATYRGLHEFVKTLQSFKNLNRLAVTLVTQRLSLKPVTTDQLNHALPFYDLLYADWTLWCLSELITKPAKVVGPPALHLDTEWHKICAQRNKELNEDENQTFTTKSIFHPIGGFPH